MSAEVLAKVCILYNTSMEYLLTGCEPKDNVIIPEIMISLGKYNVEQQKHMYAALNHMMKVFVQEDIIVRKHVYDENHRRVLLYGKLTYYKELSWRQKWKQYMMN